MVSTFNDTDITDGSHKVTQAVTSVVVVVVVRSDLYNVVKPQQREDTKAVVHGSSCPLIGEQPGEDPKN